MQDPPLPEVIVWEQCRPLFDLLLTSLFILVAVQWVTMVVVVCCLCRETTRADREKTAIAGRFPENSAQPKDSPDVESHCLSA